MSITLTVFSLAVVMFSFEKIFPRNDLSQVKGWWVRVISFNLIQVGSVFLAGVSWDRWMLGKSLWKFDFLGTWGGVVFGYLMITFTYYWWHRWRHEIPFFWRWFHQIHHSPQRLEILTSFFKHPLEIIINSILSSAILYLLVGLDVRSASLAVFLTGIAELFYHWNFKTPYWLGFIIQRPESHLIHHKRDWHHQNYADLPLWDILFGTFYNPKTHDTICGFESDRELLLRKMMLGENVNRTLKEVQP